MLLSIYKLEEVYSQTFYLVIGWKMYTLISIFSTY